MQLIVIDDFVLKFYEDKDLKIFIELFTDFELCKFMAGGAYDKEKDAEKLFRYFQEISKTENTSTKAYGVFINNILIGHFETNKKDTEIEIAFLLKKEYWGKGIMSNVISHFNNVYQEKLFARVLPNNTNSTRMLEKLDIEKKTLSKFNEQNVIRYQLNK